MLIEASNLVKTYGKGDGAVAALSDVSFAISEGEFVAVMGPSGSGKTTLMNLIGLLDQPGSGTLSVSGRDSGSLSPDRLAGIRNSQIGFVFQSYNLLARNTALENVELPLIYSRLGRAERRRRAMAALDELGLSHRYHHMPSQLSGGEQQRVAIARALVVDPDLILADEPTGAVDSRTGNEILSLFQKMNGNGRTIVMVTHDEKVAGHAGRKIFLQDGRLVGDADNSVTSGSAATTESADEGTGNSRTKSRSGMSWWQSLRIALRSLRARKLRSFLTILGIIVGVASVITMVAVGAGAQTQIAEQIRSLGANVLMILPGAAREDGARLQSGSRHTLTEADAAEISRIRFVLAAAPSIRGKGQVIQGNRNWNTTVNGTRTDYFLIREWLTSSGRHFSPREEQSAAKVALIGATVAEKLFGSEDSTGREIRIATVPFLVVGVLAEKGPSGSGRDQDDVVFVPISTAKLRLFGSANEATRQAVSYVLVKAVNEDVMQAAKDHIEGLLRQRHRIVPDRENDFTVTNPAAIMAAQRAGTRTMAWLLLAVGSISLVVGGISIMNIMLVSVAERTREIGLRLVVGARRRDIRNQFLMEAVTLCLLGGLIGIALGIGVSAAIARLAGWPIFIGVDAVLFAVGFAAAIGIFFGYYPARKAARLDPVVALRSE